MSINHTIETLGISSRARFLFATMVVCSIFLLGALVPASAADITTDKSDYAPFETVYITGEGFTPGATVTMTVEWPSPSSGIHNVLPAAIADDRGFVSAAYSLTSGPDGWGLEGTYIIVAVDSVTGQRAVTTFTDAPIPSTEHWIIFETPGFPSPDTYVHVTYSGTNPIGNAISGTPYFRAPLLVKTKPGTTFTYHEFDATVVIGGETYTLISTSPSSSFTTGSGGASTYITATYAKEQSNSAPDLSVIDPVTVDEGLDATATGTWSDANAGDTVTLSASAGIVTNSGSNTDGTWFWSYPATDGPVQSSLVTITADDGMGGRTQQSFELTVNNVPPTSEIAGAPATSPEGEPITLTASATDPGSDDTAAGFTFSWIVEKDGVEYDTGNTEAFSFTPDDNGEYTVTLKSIDKDGGEGIASTTIGITNLGPTVGQIIVIMDPMKVNAPVTFSSSFADKGTADTHTAIWSWGDGTESAGEISESGESSVVRGSHSYSAPGIYTVTLAVTDKDGAVGSPTVTVSVVVYDPGAGFVTGGGWFTSPAGAYRADTGLTGKANFGFTSKYKKGTTVPECSVEFQFKPGNLKFKSHECSWLVVSGQKATFEGIGTVNGAGRYGFQLSAIEGSTDTFGIKIWNLENNAIVYDTTATAIGGGNVAIHS